MLAIIVTAMVLTGTGLLLSSNNKAYAQTLDSIAVVVNDDLIMRSELDEKITAERLRLQRQNQAIPADDLLQQQVMETLIAETIQRQRAVQQNIQVSETMLNNAIKNIASNNNLTLAQLHQAIQSGGETVAEFRTRIKEEMTLHEVRKVEVSRRIKVTEAEIDRFLASGKGQTFAETEYLLAHILIAANPDDAEQTQQAEQTLQTVQAALQAGAAFTDTAITYSDANNASQGGVLGWRKASQLPDLFADVLDTLTVNAISPPLRNNRGIHLIQILDLRGTATQTAQQTRARHILVLPNDIRDDKATQALAQSIHERLQDGTPFAELAGTFSDDRRTALEGGDMGWLEAHQLPQFMQQQLDALDTGNFSAPFRGPNGWHLLQVTQRQVKNVGQNLLRQQARKQLFDSKFADESDRWLSELRHQAYVEIR